MKFGCYATHHRGLISRPHLSIAQPHCSHVQPPHIAWDTDFGLRIVGINWLQRGQLTGLRLVPHLPFRRLPRMTKMPVTRATAIIETMKTNNASRRESMYDPTLSESNNRENHAIALILRHRDSERNGDFSTTSSEVLTPRCGRQLPIFARVVFRRNPELRHDLSSTRQASVAEPLSLRRCESLAFQGTPRGSH